MRWRRIPPVHSPIAPSSFLPAAGAALGLSSGGTDDLEDQLATIFDAHEVLLTNSGTSALILALQATVSPDDVIALPGYTCIDVIAASIRAGVRVALYDLEPETLNPDLGSVRHALALGARALVVAPLFGYPPDMLALTALAREYQVPVIEDAAQGAGGTLHSRRVGAFGDVSVVSFGRGKGITSGAGGALLVRQPALTDWARHARTRLRSGGRGTHSMLALAAQWLLARPQLYSIPTGIPLLRLGEMVYHPAPEPSALSASAAPVLRHALALDAEEMRVRQGRAEQLGIACERGHRFRPVRPIPAASPGYLRLAVLERTTAVPEPQFGALRPYPITLDEHPESARVLVSPPARLPGARTIRDRLLTFPTHSRMTERDLDRLVGWAQSNGAPSVPRNEAA